MYYLLKAGRRDIMYHTFQDGTGGLIALCHLDKHSFPVLTPPPDTKVYKAINGRIAYEVWPRNKERQYRTEFRRLRSRWPSTLGEIVAKSESQPDFVFE